jgi:hypothetical protein
MFAKSGKKMGMQGPEPMKEAIIILQQQNHT